MPTTIVRCSMPGCQEAATQKIAAPWQNGRFSELKTYGFACPAHADSVLLIAERRPKPRLPTPGESVGGIAAYDLVRA